ncbi:MAG TPA: sensor histidine kinase [Actinocrinis sp.]|nr:sensor histidine kinase [Actinocrinis sp.]
MNSSLPWHPRHEWERRWLPKLEGMAYVLVAVMAAFTVALNHSKPETMVPELALCGAIELWMLWMYTLHRTWHESTAKMVLYVAVLAVLIGLLVLEDSWFGFLTPVGYFYAFNALPRPWDLRLVAVMAIVAGKAQAAGVKLDSPLGIAELSAVLLINLLPMCGLVWFGWNDDIQQDKREQDLEDVNEANRRLEATLAENAGLHAQLVTQAREAGVLDERARMAREIHDTLAQGLAGIVTQLQAAEQSAGDPARWRRHFAAATGLARESLSEARRSVDALRPEPLEAGRLGDAFADVAQRWSAIQGVEAQVTTTGTPRAVPPEAEFALLRTLQEALANVAKHAQASRVVVTLSYLETDVALDVRDDGRGFDGQAAAGRENRGPAEESGAAEGSADATQPGASGGFGLIAMRQRIDALSGTLQIESEPGVGTTVSACVPQQATEAGVRS